MSHCRALIALCALFAVGLLAGALRADPPAMMPGPSYGPNGHAPTQTQPYLVLKGENVGQPYPVSSPAYAYGWFGVCPRARHVHDGTGYYNHYSQSSIRRGY